MNEDISVEERKASLDQGDFVSFKDASGNLQRGCVVRNVNYGAVRLLDQAPVYATEENPALVVNIYKSEKNGFVATENNVAINAQSVDFSSPLPPPRELPKTQWAKINGNEIDIYGEIGGFGEFSALNFVNDMKKIKGSLQININSYGGDVFEGVVVRNALKARKEPVNIVVTGVAASIASYILTGADHVSMPTNAAIMVHEPWAGVVGNARDMYAMGEALSLTKRTLIDGYVEKTKGDRDQWEMMVERETWFDGAQAAEAGLVDSVLDSVDMAASCRQMSIDEARMRYHFKNLPKALTASDGRPNLAAARKRLSAQRIEIFNIQQRLDSLN